MMYDFEWFFDVDSGFGLLYNMYILLQYITKDLFGYIAVTIPFFAIWILTKKVINPTVLYMIIGTPLMLIAPYELKGVAMLMLIFSGGGIMYRWFVER